MDIHHRCTCKWDWTDLLFKIVAIPPDEPLTKKEIGYVFYVMIDFIFMGLLELQTTRIKRQFQTEENIGYNCIRVHGHWRKKPLHFPLEYESWYNRVLRVFFYIYL